MRVDILNMLKTEPVNAERGDCVKALLRGDLSLLGSVFYVKIPLSQCLNTSNVYNCALLETALNSCVGDCMDAAL